MPVYALGEHTPQIHPSAYIAPEAVIIGQVSVGAESTIWPCAVLRGDEGLITVGERTSIQDGAIIHVTPADPTTIGNDCTVGHLAHLEGCTIEDGGLVGTAAVVLHRAIVGSWALVAANAVVLADTEIPPEALAIGIPAKIKESASNKEAIELGVKAYVKKGRLYKGQLKPV